MRSETQAVEETLPSQSRSVVEALKESRLVSYWQEEWKPLAVVVGVFLACYYIPDVFWSIRRLISRESRVIPVRCIKAYAEDEV